MKGVYIAKRRACLLLQGFRFAHSHDKTPPHFASLGHVPVERCFGNMPPQSPYPDCQYVVNRGERYVQCALKFAGKLLNGLLRLFQNFSF
jgi:hypothetical protein